MTKKTLSKRENASIYSTTERRKNPERGVGRDQRESIGNIPEGGQTTSITDSHRGRRGSSVAKAEKSTGASATSGEKIL